GGPTCSTGDTIPAGVPNEMLLTSAGAAPPLSWGFVSSPPPPRGVTLIDNGNGSAILGGTPPSGTSDTFLLYIVARAVGTIGLAANYPLTVVNRPVFTSPNTATFTAGHSGSFSVSASTGTIASGSALPTGLSFTS